MMPSELPDAQLHAIRAAVVAARGEDCRGAGDLGEGLLCVPQALDAGRIVPRADKDEVVVHDVAAIDAVDVGDEFVLAGPIMHEKRVGVAARADGERLPGADGDDAHIDSGRSAKDRDQMAEEARFLGRGGRGERDEALLREGRHRPAVQSR